MTATTVGDELARADLLGSAVRLALSNEPGDTDRILDAVAHSSLDVAQVHRLFATLIETTGLLRALRPYMPDGSPELLACYDEAVTRRTLAAVVLLCGEPVVDPCGVDAETERAA